MTFIPYQSILNIDFDSSKESLMATLGEPKHKRTTDLWAFELEYKQGCFRFDKNNQFKEASLDLKEIFLDGELVKFKQLLNFIKPNDPIFFEKVGFYISPKYGLAFDPYYESWITFFDNTELTKWQNF